MLEFFSYFLKNGTLDIQGKFVNAFSKWKVYFISIKVLFSEWQPKTLKGLENSYYDWCDVNGLMVVETGN